MGRLSGWGYTGGSRRGHYYEDAGNGVVLSLCRVAATRAGRVTWLMPEDPCPKCMAERARRHEAEVL